MCDILNYIIENEKLKYSITVMLFSLIIVIINEFILIISGKSPIKYHENTNKIFKMISWVAGATLTSLILAYFNLVTMTHPSAIIISFGWIKLYSDLYEKHNNHTELPKIEFEKGES